MSGRWSRKPENGYIQFFRFFMVRDVRISLSPLHFIAIYWDSKSTIET